jgi:hypothetical protein
MNFVLFIQIPLLVTLTTCQWAWSIRWSPRARLGGGTTASPPHWRTSSLGPTLHELVQNLPATKTELCWRML